MSRRLVLIGKPGQPVRHCDPLRHELRRPGISTARRSIADRLAHIDDLADPSAAFECDGN
jgi:hypothetical protein